MNRVPGPVTTLHDRVTFDAADYRLPVLGICAECLAASSTSAACCTRIGRQNRGVAADVERCQISTPTGRGLLWEPGRELPPDAGFVAELVRLFGEDATFTGPDGAPLPMFAVTTVAGTLLCPVHAVWSWETVRKAAAARGGRL